MGDAALKLSDSRGDQWRAGGGFTAREERDLRWFFADHSQEIMECQRTAVCGPMIDKLQQQSVASVACPTCDGTMLETDKRGRPFSCRSCNGTGSVEISHTKLKGRAKRKRNGVLVADGSDWFNGDLTAQPNETQLQEHIWSDYNTTPDFGRYERWYALARRMRRVMAYNATSGTVLELMFGLVGDYYVSMSESNAPNYRGGLARRAPILLMTPTGKRLAADHSPHKDALLSAIRADFEPNSITRLQFMMAEKTAATLIRRAALQWRATDDE